MSAQMLASSVAAQAVAPRFGKKATGVSARKAISAPIGGHRVQVRDEIHTSKDRNTIVLAERRVAVDARAGIRMTNRGWPDDAFARHGSSAQPPSIALPLRPRRARDPPPDTLETAIVYPFPPSTTPSTSPVSDSLDPPFRPAPQAAPKAIFAVNAAAGKKTAIVTGASSGLGLYTTKALVDRGDYHVVMAVRGRRQGRGQGQGAEASRRLLHRDGARARRPQVRA